MKMPFWRPQWLKDIKLENTRMVRDGGRARFRENGDWP